MITFNKKFLLSVTLSAVFIFSWPSLASATACSHTCGPYSTSGGGYSYGNIYATAEYSVPSGDTCSSGWPSWGCDLLHDEAVSMISPTTLSASWNEGCGNTHSYSGSITGVPANTVGTCGSAATTTTPSYTQPTTNLCGPVGGVTGGPTSTFYDIADTITGSNPLWKWKCLGTVSATTIDDAVCTVPMASDGKCGTATSSAPSATPPTMSPFSKICLYPTTDPGININNTSTTFNWTCPGINGGSNTSCNAPRLGPPVCGSTVNTCTVGTSTPIDQFSWNCTGPDGTTGSCNITAGACGVANGTVIQSSDVSPTTHHLTPESLECTTGTSTGLTLVNSVYQWQCFVANYLSTTTCQFYRCASGPKTNSTSTCLSGGYGGLQCGNGFIDSVSPMDCKNPNSTGTFQGYICGSISSPASCSSVINGICGTAARTYSSSESFPNGSTYCSSGSPTPSTPNNPTTSTPSTWTCSGSPICTATRQAANTAGVRIDFFRFTPSIATAVSPSTCPAFWRTSLTGTDGDPDLVSCTIGSQTVASSSSSGYPLPPGLYTLSCKYDNLPSTTATALSRCSPNPNYHEN